MSTQGASRQEIAGDLVMMARADQEVRAALASRGVLFGGYNREMRALHERNAGRLEKIMRAIGWPSAARVGTEASQAAWLVAQHAISRPDTMRAARDAIRREADAGRASKANLALLEDRIAMLEGRPQLYGTQLDWDTDGQMSPTPIENEADVDRRRAAMGLGPLAEHVANARAGIAKEGEAAPRDLKAYRRAAAAFAVEVGWRSGLTK